MTRLLPVLALLAGCSDQFENEVGGPNGSNSGGYDGPQHCWDLDYDGEADANEDTNGDGTVDVYDCRGEDGGGSGSNGSDGQDCWDLDGDGVGDPEEDTNGDGVIDVYDCRDEGGDGGGDGGDDTGNGDGGEYGDYYLGRLEIDRAEAVDAFCDRYSGIIGTMVVEVAGEDIDRLDCLVEVIGDLSLRETDVTDSTDFDLTSLTTVTGTLNVRAYGDVEFARLQQVGGALQLHGQSNFGSVGFSFPLLEDVGLEMEYAGLNYVGGDGTTSSSWSGFVQSLSCPSLVEINGPVELTVGKGLQNLDGLSAVQTIRDNLIIRGSKQLSDVTGLHGLSLVGGAVVITDNPSLSTSAAEALVAEIDVIGGTVTVSGNGPG